MLHTPGDGKAYAAYVMKEYDFLEYRVETPGTVEIIIGEDGDLSYRVSPYIWISGKDLLEHPDLEIQYVRLNVYNSSNFYTDYFNISRYGDIAVINVTDPDGGEPLGLLISIPIELYRPNPVSISTTVYLLLDVNASVYGSGSLATILYGGGKAR